MRRVSIHNLGPLREAVIDLQKINVVIGPQSSGKSCVLKTASYCAWVEKRIQLAQSHEYFAQGDHFIHRLVTFHKLKGYIKEDTRIEYESDAMKFGYDCKSGVFTFEWGAGRWDYVTPKISYIPAERNMVGAITNWFEISLPDDNIRNFMSDWQRARTTLTSDLKILNLGVRYHYDKAMGADQVILRDGHPLEFTNTSSGLQSLIPASVVLDYLFNTRFRAAKENSILRQEEYAQLARKLHALLNKDRSAEEQKAQAAAKEIITGGDKDTKDESHTKSEFKSQGVFIRLAGIVLKFDSPEDAKHCSKIYHRLAEQGLTEVYIEEPEQNLFPPTQGVLAHHIVNDFMGPHGGTLFVATHSPYMVSSILGRTDVADRLGLFIMHEGTDGSYTVERATEQDVQRIYDLDSDAFFNL